MIEAGYITGKTIEDAEELPDNSGEAAALKDAARKRMENLLKAGVRPLSAPDTPFDDNDESRKARKEINKTEADSVKGFPKPTAQQNAEANRLFTP